MRNLTRISRVVISILLFFSLGLTPLIGGQLHVPISHGVYQVIQQLELVGAVQQLSGVKPYTESYITDLLNMALSKDGLLSPEEEQILRGYLAEFSPKEGGYSLEHLLDTGSMGTETQDGKLRTEVGTKISSFTAIPVTSFADYDLRNVLDIYLAADITESASILIAAGLRIDKLDTQAYAPYRFTTPGEGFYFYFQNDINNNIGYSDGEFITIGSEFPLTTPVIGFDMESDLVLTLLDNAVQLSWGMYERDWGFGTNGLLLSGTARVFDAVEGRLRLSDWLQYSYLTGTLTPAVLDYVGDATDNFQNMVTMKRVELLLPFSLKLSLYESCVWVKRFELGYLNPFMISMLYQNILGDYDNMYAGVELEYAVPGFARIYGSMAVDEMHHINPALWFKEARDIFALQAGIEISVPKLPFTSANFQYTLISPFFYTHYLQNYPIYDTSTTEASMITYYINKGESLGYYIPPNSDEFLFNFTTRAIPDTELGLTIGWVRHSGQYGDSLEKYFDYDKYIAGAYPEKNFNENIVKSAVSAALNVNWNIPRLPVSLSGGYVWIMDSTRSDPTNSWDITYQNIVSFGVNVYY